MSGQHNKYERRRIRRYRIRKRVSGSVERPRLSVFRSSRTSTPRSSTTCVASRWWPLRAARTCPREGKGKLGVCTEVGKRLAARAKEKGVARVCFDRGGYLYHGRVKALADGARAGGLEF